MFNFNIYNSAVPGYNVQQYLRTVSIVNDFDNIKKIYYIFTLNDVAKMNDQAVQMVDYVRKLKEQSRRGLGIVYYLNVFLRNKSFFIE